MMLTDRLEAGRLLAEKLSRYKGRKDAIILGIPRGGVEVAYAIAKELGLKLGIALSKKLPFPGNPELAMGAVAFGGAASIDDSLALQQGAGKDYVENEKKRLSAEIRRRYKAYGAKFPDVKGKTVIVADDGMATGHTVLAAARAARKRLPKKVIVAVPVASQQAADMIKAEADELVCLDVPEWFMAVGEFYRNFPQLSDEDVTGYLRKAKSA